VVRDALSLNPSLRVMASPWSAPGWMKTSGALIHGTLLPQFYGTFANYLTKYVDAMQAQGIPIYALTVQNEPHFDTPNYPGMLLGADARAQLIGKYLGPELAGPRSPCKSSAIRWRRPLSRASRGTATRAMSRRRRRYTWRIPTRMPT
jgi:glucosylceramidase